MPLLSAARRLRAARRPQLVVLAVSLTAATFTGCTNNGAPQSTGNAVICTAYQASGSTLSYSDDETRALANLIVSHTNDPTIKAVAQRVATNTADVTARNELATLMKGQCG